MQREEMRLDGGHLGAFSRPYDAVAVCRPCLEALVHQTVEGATSDPVLAEKALAEALAILADHFGPGVVPARTATLFGRRIKAVTGCEDPFQARKEMELQVARQAMERVEVPTGLQELLSFAALGNSVDYFLGPEETAAAFRAGVEYAIDHRARFLSWLLERPGKRLFYLADNAAEALFDWPLAEALARRGVHVSYVVKGGPVQNDCTRADLEAAGLEPGGFELVDNGTDAVGTDLRECSPSFVEALLGADAVLAKGMANFETLREVRLPPTLFLLKAKCEVNAALIGVPRNKTVALFRR